MRAVVMRNSKLVVDTVPDPVPQEGEILVKTLACGICGSDVHALKHAARMVEVSRESGAPFTVDLRRDVIMGHEFCAEVIDFGPNASAAVRRGERVVAMPILFRGGRMEGIGYSNEASGGYAERMVLSASLALRVPDGLPTEHAALTEPMAVGVHAVAKAQLGAHDAALVIGCGPVGLAVIAALKLRVIAPIVAADFSATRRRLAQHLGADVVVNPAEEPAIEAFHQAADLRPAVIFECVGVAGMLRQVMRDAPRDARVVVAGVCMEDDVIEPLFGINKELALQFVFGYTPAEFADTLQAIADGKIDVSPLVTGRVGLDGVPQAFDELAHPDTHAKILVEP